MAIFGWGVVIFVTFALLPLFTVKAFRGDLPRFHGHGGGGPVACASVGCAELGDSVTYVLNGKVMSVSSPQAGVVCVEVAAAKEAGQYCALAGR